ncbi:MAG: hypothetical protein ABIX10_09575 [Acidimicrobiales bacterium]
MKRDIEASTTVRALREHARDVLVADPGCVVAERPSPHTKGRATALGNAEELREVRDREAACDLLLVLASCCGRTQY